MDDIQDMKAKVDDFSPPERLRIAAQLIEEGNLVLAEAIAGTVVDELRALRLFSDCRHDRH